MTVLSSRKYSSSTAFSQTNTSTPISNFALIPAAKDIYVYLKDESCNQVRQLADSVTLANANNFQVFLHFLHQHQSGES